MRHFAVASCLAGVLLAGSASASIIHVDVDGGGDFETIQEGIDAASLGDTVLVAAGIYTGEGNRDLDFGGTNLVLMSEEGPDSTVIDCEGEARGFIFQSAEDSTSVVRGFTVASGADTSGGGVYCSGASPRFVDLVFTGNEATGGPGGAVFCALSSAAIESCGFSDNTASGDGGAIFYEDSSLMLTASVFSDNSSESDGGAVFFTGSTAVVDSCEFTGNSSEGDGGAVCCALSSGAFTLCSFSVNTAFIVSGGASYARGGAVSCDGSFVTVDDCLFDRNSSQEGGAVSSRGNSVLTIGECEFTDNDASGLSTDHAAAGGAISARGDSLLAVEGSTLSSNTAEAGGGAVYSTAGSTTIRLCDIERNSGTWGGGIYCGSPDATIGECSLVDNSAGTGAGLYCGNSDATIVDCSFLLNDAGVGNGAGIYCINSDVTIAGCVLHGNTAGSGAAMYCNGSDASLTGCSLNANSADGGAGGGGVYCLDSALSIERVIIARSPHGAAVACGPGGYATTFRCCLFGNADGDVPCGSHFENLYTDPWFCNAAGGGFGLFEFSPCLPENNEWGVLIGASGETCPGYESLPEDQRFVLDEAVTGDYPGLVMAFDLEGPTSVTVRIYDLLGNLVAKPIDGEVIPAGKQVLSWNLRNPRGTKIASGTYFVVAEIGDETIEREIAVLSKH